MSITDKASALAILYLLSLAGEKSVLALSLSDSAEATAQFNLERCLVNPPAKSMNFITWDPDLATKAANKANRCTYDGRLGSQAVFVKADQTATLREAITFIRTTLRNDYDYEKNASKSLKYDVRPYKQTVLAKETKFGCAVSQCPKGIISAIDGKPMTDPANPTRFVFSWVVCEFRNDAGQASPYTRASSTDGKTDACGGESLSGKMKIAFPDNKCVDYLKAVSCSGEGVDKFVVTKSSNNVVQLKNLESNSCLRSNGSTKVSTWMTYGSCANTDANFELQERTNHYYAFKHKDSNLCLEMSPGSYGSTQLQKRACDTNSKIQQFTFIQ